RVSDGTSTLTFEMDDNGSVAAGNLAIPFTTTQTAAQIEASIAQAINNANSAGSTQATAVVLAAGLGDTSGAQSITYTPLDPSHASLGVDLPVNAFVAEVQGSDGSVVWARQLTTREGISEWGYYLAVNSGVNSGAFLAMETAKGGHPFYLIKL